MNGMELVNRQAYLDRILMFRDTDLIKVVTGVRRCGKSSLLKLAQDKIESEGAQGRAADRVPKVGVRAAPFHEQEAALAPTFGTLPIYPSWVMHEFNLMFDQGTPDVLSYHPATVVAEKPETVLSRGEANTRGRDFYDFYAVPRYYSEAVNAVDSKEALLRTGERRRSARAVSPREI